MRASGDPMIVIGPALRGSIPPAPSVTMGATWPTPKTFG